DASPVTVMKGEIGGIEPHYDEEMNAWLTIRGYDKRHRLNLGTKVETYLNQKDSDIVNMICGAVGVPCDVEATSTIHKYVIQHNQTDLEFLQERAYRNGYELAYEDNKLKFRKPVAGKVIELTRGKELRSFTPRLSAAGQVNEVTVKSWDPAQKKEVIGKATTSNAPPSIGYGKWGGAAAQSAFKASTYTEVRQNVGTPGEAETLAKSILDDINANFIEAEGMTFGNPNIRAGVTVNLKNLGQRFSGSYKVTSATHIYNDEGYNTIFRIEGKKPNSIASLTQTVGSDGRWIGVVPAIVTNNQDPDNQGRVKVKFPWLDDTKESNWARLCLLGAGNERGIWWMPEVNDEVLVTFVNGDFDYPIILGGLNNGQDKTVEPQTNTVKNGKVVRRTIKTRLGHVIRFVDDDSEKYIEIIDSQGTQIKLDAQSKELLINGQGDVKLDSKGNVKVKATGNIDVESSANVTIKGTGNVTIQASGQLVLKGAQVAIN